MFENIEQAKREIRTRTSKIIGGYITEQLFSEYFHALYPDRMYSTGWWGGIENSVNKKLTFFIVKSVLNDLDTRVIDKLRKNGYLCNQVIMKDDKIYICTEDVTVLAEEYAREHDLSTNLNPNGVRNEIEGDPNLEKCIKWYERNGTLCNIATNIYIENHFLNVYYYISNIDLICENAERCPTYMEIKFKNEFLYTKSDGTKELVFGIDELQYEKLFQAFLGAGMLVENIILYNDIKNKRNTTSTVILDFLNEKDDNNYIWKSISIDPQKKYEQYQFSSSHTSWNGNKGRTVRCIPLREYRDFGSKVDSGQWGICPKCGNGYKVIRKYNSNEFFGCTNYRNHNSVKG